MSDVTITQTWTLRTDESADVRVEGDPVEGDVRILQDEDRVFLLPSVARSMAELLHTAADQAEGLE